MSGTVYQAEVTHFLCYKEKLAYLFKKFINKLKDFKNIFLNRQNAMNTTPKKNELAVLAIVLIFPQQTKFNK